MKPTRDILVLATPQPIGDIGQSTIAYVGVGELALLALLGLILGGGG